LETNYKTPIQATAGAKTASEHDLVYYVAPVLQQASSRSYHPVSLSPGA